MMVHPWLFALALAVGAAHENAGPVQTAVPGAPNHWLDEPQTPPVATRHGSMAAFGAIALLGFGAAGAYVLYRNQARPKDGAGGGAIDVLALKSLGGRQRLALVEVCGERLLLAATEREVTLLSHLPGALSEADSVVATEEQVEATITKAHVGRAPQAEISVAAQQSAEASGFTVASMEAALSQAPVSAEPSAFAADLAGLQQWHAQAQTNERRA
jgi:flagellar biogenesis protein FliO